MARSRSDNKRQRRQLADYLVAHRETILNRWRTKCDPDKALQERTCLCSGELADPLPALLTFFTQSIAGREIQESDVVERVCHHQIHRWQGGYPLTDLLAELDNFYDSLDKEIQHFLERYPQTHPGVIVQAYTQLRHLSKTVNTGVVLPVDQLRQIRANEQLKQLMDDLHQQAHDLRSHLGVISTATSLLQGPLTDDERAKYMDMIRRNVKAADQLMRKWPTLP